MIRLQIQYDVNKEAVKISALSGKLDKYEFLTGQEILLSDQIKITEKANFIYSPLGKTFLKTIKTTEDQHIKQVETLKALKSEENKEDIKSIEEIFPKGFRNYEIKNEIYEIKKWEEKFKQKALKYK